MHSGTYCYLRPASYFLSPYFSEHLPTDAFLAPICRRLPLRPSSQTCRQKRANLARREMEAVEEAEDTNHIMVVPASGHPPPDGADNPENGKNGGPQLPFQKPKPKMQVEIRAFTKESLEKINLRTANLIRDYGYLPKRAAHLEDGCELPMKFGTFPPHLRGKPVEELDQFVYEKVRP